MFCFQQACKFRDEYAKFQDAGAQVFGISSDTPEDNKAFATSQRLPFALLTDPSSILRKVGGGHRGQFAHRSNSRGGRGKGWVIRGGGG